MGYKFPNTGFCSHTRLFKMERNKVMNIKNSGWALI